MKNISSIFTSAITGLLVLSGGFLWLVFLLVAMNGFSERQAMPVLIAHLVISLLAALAFGLAGVWLKNSIVLKTSWHIAFAVVTGIFAASVAGIFVVCAGSLVAMFIASEMISR